MENITVQVSIEKIQQSFAESVNKILKDDYNNPIKKAFDAAINEKSGEIKKVVDEIIVSAISDPAFKAKIADAVISKMVESAIKR
jgi:hypothetical protein